MSVDALGTETVDFVQPSALRRVYEFRRNGSVVGRLRRSLWTRTAAIEANGHRRWQMTVRGAAGPQATVSDAASGEVIARLAAEGTLTINNGPTLTWRRLGAHKGWVCATQDGREVIRARRDAGLLRLSMQITIAPGFSWRDGLASMFLASHMWLLNLETVTGGAAGGGAAAGGAAG